MRILTPEQKLQERAEPIINSLFDAYCESIGFVPDKNNTWFDGGMKDFAEFILVDKGYLSALSSPNAVVEKMAEALKNIDSWLAFQIVDKKTRAAAMRLYKDVLTEYQSLTQHLPNGNDTK